MPNLFKPGYGSKLSKNGNRVFATRDLAVKAMVNEVLTSYPACINEDGLGRFDVGDQDCVSLVDPFDPEFCHILFWMAKAAGIELNSGELFQVQEQLDTHASRHGVNTNKDQG